MMFVWSAIELMIPAMSEIPEIFSLSDFIPSKVTSFACLISESFCIFCLRMLKPSFITSVVLFATRETSPIFEEMFLASESDSSIAARSSLIPEFCSSEVAAVSFEITESSLLDSIT